jgi:phosphoenolpyruvate-protein kinase (PTS system EI component)
VVVRTLDVGGDKVAPALDLHPVRNGFLGSRGLRWSLRHPDALATQLRAILRAARGRRVRLMFPMVTTVEEVRAARVALDEARRALDDAGTARGEMEQIGIMVEVPAAAVTADLLAPEVDFFSVGSNDLLSYVMAADRTVAEVAMLRDPRHPALLRLVAEVCEAASAAGIWVGVCGEIAGDPELAALLVALGVTELSMAPPAVPAVKARLRTADLDRDRATARAVARAG